MQSPSYHGYDVTDYETIEADYGTNADFRVLMDAAHTRGIRVIVDFPVNHTSVDHPWFREAAADPNSPYRDWYIFSDTDPGYVGPWGEVVWHENPYGRGWYYGIFDKSMPDLTVANLPRHRRAGADRRLLAGRYGRRRRPSRCRQAQD